MKQWTLPGSDELKNLNSLVDLLHVRGEKQAGDLAYRFIQEDDSDPFTITYSELDRRARAIGAWFESFGAGGERALLLYPPGLDYIAAFFGCLYAGVTAIPAYPPRLNRPVPRIQSMVADSQASYALTTSTILHNIEQRFEYAPDLQALRWLDTDQVPAGLEADWRPPAVSAGTLAFLQYTSGSTSQPKGVMLSHGNLIHNLEAIRRGFQIDSNTSGVFWLPSYHDMGLIGGILEPMYIGCPSTLMSPGSFLQRPFRWLDALSRYKGTTSGAPNFAYDLCAEKITAEQIETLDLSAWTLAFCGAEPVRPETLDRFARVFEPCGFRKSAFYPCFGMAESTLLVSGGEGPATPRTFILDRKALEQDRVLPVSQDGEESLTLVSCGQAIVDQKIVIANPTTLEGCTPDQVGEIWVSGPSVAQGYWGLEEETRNTFRAYLTDTGEGPFLRTGDLGFLQNGELYVTGRLKDLIIIHGSNHYPQDIELTVESAHVALQAGGGAAFSVTDGGKEQLVIVQEVARQHRRPDVNEVTAAIRQAVAEKHDLRAFAIVLVKPMSIPKTSSGKIQRRACKNAFQEGSLDVIGEWRATPSPSSPALPPSGEGSRPPLPPGAPSGDDKGSGVRARNGVRARDIQSWLVARIAAMLETDPAAIDPRQPFTYYGLGSVQAVSLTGDLEVFLGRKLAPTLAWDYPSIERLSNFLAGESQPVKSVTPTPTIPQPSFNNFNEPIAIIGLGCRFPQADSPQAFWELLRNGVDAITEVPSNRWDVDAFHSDELSPGKAMTRFGAFVDDVDLFDPQFFGISPREAARMDPQQRLLLEVSWEALENAFLPAHTLAGTRTGVFVGISSFDYSRFQFDDPARIDMYAGTGNAHSIAANRLSYVLDLRGPSIAMDTACSSSLVAAHLACQSLRTGEADLALAGGVNLILSPELTISFSQGRFLSPDGRCKTFDARADGYVRGEGCGVVVLKRLSDALRDGDSILALMRGSAVNQDGRSNGLTAPNGLAQQDVIRRAMMQAGVAPRQISYIEAHGTGTPLGDPIEMASLRAVLDDESNERVLVGSVKTNIGHLESAAGIAGLIKCVLALQNEAIPPHLHLKEINPHLSMEGSRIDIGTYLRPWKRRDQPRFAGVSSFGFGGTNAHIILSDAPPAVPAKLAHEFERPRHLLVLSARRETALHELASRISASIQSEQHAIPDLAFTANTSRSHFEHRLAIQAGSRDEMLKGLGDFLDMAESPFFSTGQARPGVKPKIAFLFPGQGPQYVGMGKQLYETQPAFRRALDECERILESILERPLLDVLFAPDTDATINQTAYAQPVLFAFEYALAQLWHSWGVEPHAMLGHSLGEYAAACIAGVFSLEDGLRLVAERSRLTDTLPHTGTMVAVFADAARIAEVLKPYQDQVSIAVTNGPDNTVISGEHSALQAVVEALTGLGISSKPLNIPHASHSPMMDPILDDFELFARRAEFSPPRIPIVSNLTGDLHGPGQIPDAAYWRKHNRGEVKFFDGMQSLARLGIDVFIEIGPSSVVLGMGKRCLPESHAVFLSSLRPGRDDWQTILEGLGKLYVQGTEVDWAGFDSDYARRRVSLPNYPFERERYWLEPSNVNTELQKHSSALSTRSSGKSDSQAEKIGNRENGKAQARENETLRSQKPPARPVPASLQERKTNELDHASLLAVDPAQRQTVVEGFLQKHAARILGMEPARLDPNQPLDTMGLDSLMAMEFKNAFESRLGVQLPVSSLLQGPTIFSLAAQILEHLDGPESLIEIPAVAASDPEGAHPLTHNQSAMWFLDQLMPPGISFNVSGAVRLIGDLDQAALKRAFEALMTRHPILRTTFHVLRGQPMQKTHERWPLPLREEDATRWTEATLQSVLEDIALRSFDLEHEVAFRVVLLKRSERETILQVTFHHIITDFWSMALLGSEIMSLYAAEKQGQTVALPLPRVSYTDFAHWRNNHLAGPEGERHWEYWRGQLAGELPVLDLPADRPRPPVQTYRGATLHIQVSAELTQQLKDLAASKGATLYMVLLSAFQALLHRYSGQTDILVGSAMAGRNHPDLAGIMGYFVNPVCMRADFSDDPSFNALLERARQTVLDALDHQDFPPPLLAERLHIPNRDASRPPLFETTFIYEKAHIEAVRGLNSVALGIPGARIEMDGLTVESMNLLRQPAQFDLTLMMAETGEGMSAAFIYKTDLFDSSTMERFAGHFHTLLDEIASAPESPLSTIPLLSARERMLIDQLNSTASDYPRERCLHELIGEQAARTPDSLAVVFHNEHWTYRELNEQADRIAAHLQSLGVGPETLVGLCVERSPLMLAALLGILKAGGAYLPLDPTFPLERLAFMLADSSAPVLITQSSCAALFPEYPGRVMLLDEFENLKPPGNGSHSRKAKKKTGALSSSKLAYVLYTSGSTGRPKGVMIPHRALVNFLASMQKQPRLHPDDTLLAVTTLSFDIAGLELYLPLVTGAKVVIADRETASDPNLLMEEMERCGATVMQATPATWRMLIEAGWHGKEDLKILCGGEALPNDLAGQLLERGAELWNLYGPTETTIWSTLHRVEKSRQEMTSGGAVPIGQPIANTQVYLLDAHLQPVPIGVSGDLYIGGDGLGRGYLNRPELTAERFIQNPFEPSSIIYKTGDLARYLPDGTIEFLGRSDQQVKVRGYRIETGEVEAILAGHPSVRQAIVVARQERSSEANLVAYIVPAGTGKAHTEPGQNETDPAGLRAFLRQSLPEYMIPSAFVNLESLPLTPNGKVDRKALPAPSQERPEARQKYVAPRTPLEKELADLCAQVLGLESDHAVGAHDNFFELGGHSLLGTRLVFLLRETYGLEAAQLPLRTLFEDPTVANLAQTIERARKGERVQAPRGDFIRRGQLSLEALNAEAQLDADIAPGDLVYEHREPERILLTGATGFVGAFLLNDLLRKTSADVYCLLRAEDSEQGMGRLQRNLASYQLWDESFGGRIKPVPGDLGAPQLGLDDKTFDELAHQLDAIHHNGAMVNFVYPYHAHKSANVLGTQEILRLASRAKLKPVHVVSTLSILYSGGTNDGRIIPEDMDLDQIGAPFGGYAQSKWVAEKLVMQAMARGIPCAIYRPGLVSGHSVTGAWNTDNLISSMTRACVLLGAVPNLNVMVNIVPVDFVSGAIVQLSQDPKNFGTVFHLQNPSPLHFSKLAEWLSLQGLQSRTISFDEWRAELLRQIPHMPSAEWAPYLPLIEEVDEGQVFMPDFDLTNTLTRLNGSGIQCHPVDDALFSAYLRYFLPHGSGEKLKPKTN